MSDIFDADLVGCLDTVVNDIICTEDRFPEDSDFIFNMRSLANGTNDDLLNEIITLLNKRYTGNQTIIKSYRLIIKLVSAYFAAYNLDLFEKSLTDQDYEGGHVTLNITI